MGTILELAAADGVSLVSHEKEELTRRVRVGSHCQSLEEYLEAYHITTSVMQTRHALERVAYEAFELCHEDGITYW